MLLVPCGSKATSRRLRYIGGVSSHLFEALRQLSYVGLQDEMIIDEWKVELTLLPLSCIAQNEALMQPCYHSRASRKLYHISQQ
jgi:hypothetical protein